MTVIFHHNHANNKKQLKYISLQTLQFNQSNSQQQSQDPTKQQFITMIQLLPKKSDNKPPAPPITQFQNYYEFLSIQYPSWVYFQGFMYPSVFTAFHAARTNDVNIRRKISQIKQQCDFKKIASQIVNNADWPQRRVKVMEQLNRDKFRRSKELGMKLFATQSRMLVNGYKKGGEAESYWGALEIKGQFSGLNTLGVILTKIRDQIIKGTDCSQWVNDQNIETDTTLWPQANVIVEKEDEKVDNLLLQNKNKFMFGSNVLNDFKLQHVSISKFHASIYFSSDMQLVLVDLNSTHGTIILRNDKQIKLQALRPQSLQHQDVIMFGKSTRRYTVYFSYDEVQRRMTMKQADMKKELQTIQKIKQLEGRQKYQNKQQNQNKQQSLNSKQQNESKQRNLIKTLLELKDYSCLFVENVNRNFTYKDIKETFNVYGTVKNVRINIDKKTGRFMGSVLVYFDERTKIAEVLGNIRKEPLKFEFKIKPVTQYEAEEIIVTFATKEEQQKRKLQRQKQTNKVENEVNRRRKRQRSESSSSSERRSRSRDNSSSGSSSSSSSSSYSSRSAQRQERRHDK